MKVFLTGGTGFIGQALTQAIIKRGWSVTALVRKNQSPQAQVLKRLGAQLTTGDVTDRESMRAGMAGADIVIHNAGFFEFGVVGDARERMHAVNVTGTENVLSLAHELALPRTVYVSTTLAYGDSGSQARDESFTRQSTYKTVYEQTKTEAHQIALGYQQRGMPLVIVCPNSVIGTNDHSALGYFQRLYINRAMPPMSVNPDTIFSFVYVKDLAEGIALAAEKGRIGETYLLAGEPQTFREAFTGWGAKPGASTPKLWLPVVPALLIFAPMEPLLRMFGLPAFLSRETVWSSSINLNYSSEKARRELGWSHCSAQEMWSATLDGEIRLLAKRKDQALVERLKPLESAE